MNIIVAVYNNWGIGYKGTQPLVLSADRKFFRSVTGSSPVIMGSRTFEDLPGRKPLPGRLNVVVSRNSLIPGVTMCRSPEEAYSLVSNYGEAFVIGGSSIYSRLLPLCNKVYVTKIHADVESDVFFPNLDENTNWVLSEIIQSGEEKGIKYEMCLYQRK